LTDICISQSNQIELVHTDKLTNSILFPGAAKTVGNVHFKTTALDMFCDSAFYHQTENWLRAYGRVQINQGDTLNLFSDSLYFDGNTNIGVLQSNVRIRDNLYKMTTDSLKFNATKSIAYYTNWATIKSSQQNIVLKSIIGSYNSLTKTFLFKDSVTLNHPDYNVKSDTLEFNSLTEQVFIHGPSIIKLDTSTTIYCKKGVYDTKTDEISIWNHAIIENKNQIIEGDSLFFNQKTDFAEGFKDISIIDTINQLTLKSNYLLKEKDDLTLIDHAQIIKYGSEDTLVLQADTIFQSKSAGLKSTENIAYSNVIIEKGEIIGVCDSMYFNENDSIIKMLELPILWRENTEIKADSILITLFDDQIEALNLYQNAFISMSHDSIHFDQLSGKFIKAYIDSGKIKKINIIDNAETLYFVSETTKDSVTGEDVKTLKGANYMISSEIFIRFKNSEIHKISVIDDTDGNFDSIKKNKFESLYLKKFKWEIIRRPDSLLIK